ncbi:DegT/DnrJ/EryC1/StrS family aminotransferase [Lacihabitans sp. LS3-19]|uniref:DegT/DnrJ/EryC1/StrS family aminotransferase n=1 Tax=Lacihabitans sp. LS3-19 TaxID=2487335 RepID=UPI0020CBA9D9|nr:DegT/DnrJ/EryC1/StrS family aminotransferase [Lacihabitans sp. LS3-19]MCP9767642.1 DegT/DnrJ/EryC1/StrS family aminotransferase [Lacihabitans sp. LS3-19]
MERINVTKSFLPPQEEYQNYLSKIWDTSWLTNNGPLVVELESKISNYLDEKYFAFLGNGTIALQIAIKALDLSGEIITTPFSYCATTTSILWENLKPVFVDINPLDFNINADLIEAAITENTSAILATHVYGNPCEVEKIETIAKKHNLKVIYDAAHAFGVKYKGKSLLSYGDISTCSFHSTKVFHTVEGGSIICHSQELFDKIKLLRSFGHILDDYYLAGINGKNSEFHAAMGLCNLNHLGNIIEGRKAIFRLYDKLLNWDNLYKPTEKDNNLEYNFAYYPVVFDNDKVTKEVILKLNAENIYPRRYFYPSLNKLSYIEDIDECPISESVSTRVLSLPLYPDLDPEIVAKICKIINSTI